MQKVYLAAPFGEPNSQKRKNAIEAKRILTSRGFDVYAPWEYQIPHAWDYPNTEWGLMVFANDVYALDHSDIVVVLSYGRIDTTSGTNWEAGYAYGKGKKVIVVEVNSSAPMSIMVSNGCFARLNGISALEGSDFSTPCKTTTEQK